MFLYVVTQLSKLLNCDIIRHILQESAPLPLD